jgi:hypothetical protein
MDGLKVLLCSIAFAGLQPFISADNANGQDATAVDESAKSTDVQDDIKKFEARILSKLEMKQFVSKSDVRVVPLIESPCLRFQDPTRANDFGTIWIWSYGGRPTAILELEWYRERSDLIAAVFNQIDAGRYELQLNQNPWWVPQKTDVEWIKIEDQEEPSTDAKRRGFQMRNISRSMSAHEFWDPDNSRFELRLLSQPIHRYSDTERGIVDGSMFVFANGTNPEIALLLEVVQVGSKTEWRMGFARIGHAEMHVEIAQKSVWTVPRYVPADHTDNYWLGFVRMSKKL